MIVDLLYSILFSRCLRRSGTGVWERRPVSTLGHVRGGGPQNATGSGELAPKRTGAGCGRDERGARRSAAPDPGKRSQSFQQVQSGCWSRLVSDRFSAKTCQIEGKTAVLDRKYGKTCQESTIDSANLKNCIDQLVAELVNGVFYAKDLSPARG